jgi:hypothetical protein
VEGLKYEESGGDLNSMFGKGWMKLFKEWGKIIW